MIDHVGLRVSNLGTATAFYDAVLRAIGTSRSYSDPQMAGYGNPAFFWLHGSEDLAGGTHIAFVAPDRKSVAAFHEAGLANGGRDNGEPGLRPDYSEHYFAAFLTDPDGNNIEAVYAGEM